MGREEGPATGVHPAVLFHVPFPGLWRHGRQPSARAEREDWGGGRRPGQSFPGCHRLLPTHEAGHARGTDRLPSLPAAQRHRVHFLRRDVCCAAGAPVLGLGRWGFRPLGCLPPVRLGWHRCRPLRGYFPQRHQFSGQKHEDLCDHGGATRLRGVQHRPRHALTAGNACVVLLLVHCSVFAYCHGNLLLERAGRGGAEPGQGVSSLLRFAEAC
mmetsp:Transcript_37491/g.104190  ORF Transcript_37491/g.104190 Transcript_37491/m.104190 type:complete len:213 (-) Transcript_37491:663-1301(-)